MNGFGASSRDLMPISPKCTQIKQKMRQLGVMRRSLHSEWETPLQ
jgi:hypothetical protein